MKDGAPVAMDCVQPAAVFGYAARCDWTALASCGAITFPSSTVKLHAPKNITVEGVYRVGKLEQLKVTPESRRKDIIKP